MKVKLLPLAIGAAVALPGVAMAEMSFYGKANLAYGMADYDRGGVITPTDGDRWELTSYDSRFGVKGSEDISDNLSVIYQIEWKVDFDGSEGSDMGQRDRYVGFQGGFGTFKGGKFDTPLKKAQGKIDLFGDTTGDIKYVFVGENRVANILQYTTPDMGGFEVNFAWMPGEEFEDGTNDADNGPADSFSASVTFSTDNLYLALAQDLDVSSRAYSGVEWDGSDWSTDRTSSAPMDVTRLVGVFKMDAFQVGAMYQMAELSDATPVLDLEQDGFLVSAGFKIDAIKLKAQMGMTTITDNVTKADLDTDLTAIGADYSFSKQTNLYVHYTMFSAEMDGADDQTFDKFDLGLIHKF